MTKMISNLPRDLIEEILSRLPLKSMKAVRLTCKSWNMFRYSHRPKGCDMFNYTLGYEDKESCRRLKILRFIDYFQGAPEKQFFWYEIYDFDSGLWTTLDVTPHWRITWSSRSLSLKGNSYWCTAERSSEGYIICFDHIICFDFTRERFGPLLPLPSSVRDRRYEDVILSCVKEEKIAALFRHDASYETEFEIWITTKIEAEMVTWSKFLRMDTEPKIVFPDSFFIDEEKKVFMDVGRDYDSVKGNWDYGSQYPKTIIIDIIGEAAGYLKKLDPGLPSDQNCWPRVCSYVPSWVQIKKLACVGKRIEQSSLEKQRFDQNSFEIEKLL